jgi:receptor expression-enhancing protein 5/6
MSDGFVGGNFSQESFIQKAARFAKEQAELIHEKTGIPAKYVLVALGICVASVIIGYLDQYITCLVGIVIPSICSIRALETKDPEDDKQWLTYWVVYGLFTFIDLFSGFILKYIPFYFVLKIAFLIWLFFPTFTGATLIYNKIVLKIFNKYRPQIDEFEQSIEKKTNQYLGKVQDNIPGGSMTLNLKNDNTANNANVNLNAKV